MSNIVKRIDFLLNEKTKAKSFVKKHSKKVGKILKGTAGTALAAAGLASLAVIPDPELVGLLGASAVGLGSYLTGKNLKTSKKKVKNKDKKKDEMYKYVKTKPVPNKFFPDM